MAVDTRECECAHKSVHVCFFPSALCVHLILLHVLYLSVFVCVLVCVTVCVCVFSSQTNICDCCGGCSWVWACPGSGAGSG